MRPLSPPTDIAALNPRRGGAVLATVLVACLLVLSAQARSRSGRGTVLQEWILTAAAPLANGAASVSRTITGAVDSAAELVGARVENRRLRSDLDARDRELFRLRAEIRQLADERRLTASASILPRILASVPVFLVEARAGVHTALIGAGSERGIVPGSPLAVPSGLVGRAASVGRRLSRAPLLLDAPAAAGALIAR